MRTRRFMTATAVLTMTALAAGTGAVTAQDAAATGYTELDQAMGADQPFKGSKVSIQTQWIGGEGDNFAAVLAPFEAATGIDVQVDEIGSSHETVLRTRIEGGAPPDLAMLAQPSAIVNYGTSGKLIDVATIMDAQKLKDEHPATVGLYASGDQIWAIPYKVDVKSTVWYPIKAFEAAGYKVPTTWAELEALEAQIVADGSNPWCIGMEAGTATGWQATDWLEDIVLRTAGIDAYNKWITHELKFDSPEIISAMDILAKIFFTEGNVYGGNTAIVATPQTQPMDPMFPTDGNWDGFTPGCWMQKQATWYGPDFFPDQRTSGQPSQYIIGEDIGIFYFPPIDEAQGKPALGAGDREEVADGRQHQERFRRERQHKVGMIKTFGNRWRDALLRVLRPDGLKQPTPVREIARRRGRREPVVQRCEVRGVRPAARVTRYANAPGVDFRPRRQIVERAQAIVDGVPRERIAHQQRLQAENRVFGGRLPGLRLFEIVVPHLDALALPDGVPGKAHIALLRHRYQHILPGLMRLGAAFVAEREQDRRIGRAALLRQIQVRRDMKARVAFEDRLLDLVVGEIERADNARIQRRPFRPRPAQQALELLAELLLVPVKVLRTANGGDALLAFVEHLESFRFQVPREHFLQLPPVHLGTEEVQIVSLRLRTHHSHYRHQHSYRSHSYSLRDAH